MKTYYGIVECYASVEAATEDEAADRLRTLMSNMVLRVPDCMLVLSADDMNTIQGQRAIKTISPCLRLVTED